MFLRFLEGFIKADKDTAMSAILLFDRKYNLNFAIQYSYIHCNGLHDEMVSIYGTIPVS